MDRPMSKGLKIYTAGLFSTAVIAFVLAVPQLSVLGGMAVLAAIVGVLATAIGRDLRTVEVTSASR